ncbi:hypothetical protein XA68_17484 [Ophiocordyceps unilateralis]|uniref:PD-(D/E)XK nuclease-like domain-containing protein n=1 Tax=Ophiocordyceps unilateralis TaxID=268505 RepID=A0A2A9P308_OPHUN|nr:hypothetical protein XA68_17484 [Ophiocordyceps unilateralis]
MSTDSVSKWLNSIPEPLHPTPFSYRFPIKMVRKRGRPMPPEAINYDHRLLCDTSCGSPTKWYDAQDSTPRSDANRPHTTRSESGYSLPSSSPSSDASRRLSPREHLLSLELGQEGARIREISRLQDPSPDLANLQKTIDDISLGLGILPPSMRDQLAQHRDERLSTMAKNESCFSAARDEAGPAPSPSSVIDLLDAAFECQENLHAEASWNIEVHSEVLRLALRPPGQPQFGHLINFMPCSTASIINEYLPTFSTSKNIDFCVYMDPCHRDPKIQHAIDILRGNLSYGVINYTNYLPLRVRPIAFNIETKKIGEGWDSAALRLGVWQAAHWNMLHYLEDLAAPFSVQNSTSATWAIKSGGESTTTTSREPAQLLDFLPGIVVQGHDWYVVIARREKSQAMVWTKMAIGATNSVMGIYQVVHAIQALRKWALDTYWPRLRRTLLASK